MLQRLALRSVPRAVEIPWVLLRGDAYLHHQGRRTYHRRIGLGCQGCKAWMRIPDTKSSSMTMLLAMGKTELRDTYNPLLLERPTSKFCAKTTGLLIFTEMSNIETQTLFSTFFLKVYSVRNRQRPIKLGGTDGQKVLRQAFQGVLHCRLECIQKGQGRIEMADAAGSVRRPRTISLRQSSLRLHG